MGLTTLTGKPLMCCVIFKGVKCCSETETRIDFTVKVNSNSNTKEELFKNNFEDEIASFEPLTGKGKLFPGGPSCVFNGKVVPCITRWVMVILVVHYIYAKETIFPNLNCLTKINVLH